MKTQIPAGSTQAAAGQFSWEVPTSLEAGEIVQQLHGTRFFFLGGGKGRDGEAIGDRYSSKEHGTQATQNGGVPLLGVYKMTWTQKRGLPKSGLPLHIMVDGLHVQLHVQGLGATQVVGVPLPCFFARLGTSSSWNSAPGLQHQCPATTAPSSP